MQIHDGLTGRVFASADAWKRARVEAHGAVIVVVACVYGERGGDSAEPLPARFAIDRF